MLGRNRYSLALLAALALALPTLAQKDAPRCNLHVLKGNWGFTCAGMAPNPFTILKDGDTPLIQPFAMNGTLSSDGKGQLGGPGWADFNGTILEEFATTSWDNPVIVNPDCSGSVHYDTFIGGPDGKPAGPMDFQMVLLSENEMLGMPTNPGMTVTCRVTRIQTRD
jgi:hypothetical protein